MKTKRIILLAVANLLLFGSVVLRAASTQLTVNCPSNLVTTATSSNGAAVFFTVTASGGCSQPSVIANPPSGSLFPLGTTTVTVTASDTCGHTNYCSFTVTVNPAATPPLVLTCSSNLTVNATSSSGAAVYYTITASGGCSVPMINAYPPSGSTFPIGTTTVLTSASDTCGSTTNCSFTVTVTRPPLVLTCSSNLTVTATSSNGAPVYYTVTANGGCSPPPSIYAYPPSGSTFPIGITTVNTTASDNCGGFTNCSFTVTVNPPVYPPLVLTCSSNLTVSATSSNGAVVFFSVTATGGCNPPPYVTAYPPSGSTFPIGTTTVTSTASDSCGGITNCSFTVTVHPPVYPPLVLTCSSNLTVSATSSNGAVVFFSVTATGGCNPPPYVTAYPPSGSTFPIGTTTVTSTASDSCGGITNCSFTVTVHPPVYPPLVLTCSSNLTVSATSSNGAVVFFSVTATGGCNPPPYVTAYPPSGSTFPIGTTTVTSTASDSCGGITNCSFTVTVHPPVYPPLVLTCSSNLTVSATSSNGAVVFFSVTATGGCNPPPYVTAYPPSGSTFPIGTTTVTSTASDSCGGITNCSFTVTVVKPNCTVTVYCPSNIVVTAGGPTNVFFNVIASDSCGGYPFINSVPPSGSTFPIGTTTVNTTAYDSNGTNQCSFTVTVVRSNCLINVNCPSNIVVSAFGPTNVFFTVTASDSCGGFPNLIASPPSGSTFPIGTTTVTSTAYDSDGTNTCSFTVTVVRTNCLITVNCPSNIVVSAFGPTNVFFTVTASDSCGGFPNIIASPPSGSTFPIGTTTVTSTAYDSNGTNQCSFTVTVVRTNCLITVNCPSNIVVSAFGPTNVFFTVTASDSCGGFPNLIASPPSGSTFPIGTTTVTSTAYDSDGTNTCSFTVTVVRTNCLITVNCPSNIVVSAFGPTNVFFTVIASDSCGGYPLINSVPPSGSTFPIGTTTVTSTAYDSNGTNQCSFTVTVVAPANPQADLQIAKSANPTNAAPGQPVVFTVTLNNLGPNNITNPIVVTDCLPPEFIYVTDSTYGGGGIGTYSPGTCWWTLAGLGTNATVYLNITAICTNLGVFTNTATVAVPQGYTDPNLTNNSASAIVVVSQPPVDLMVIKTVSNITNKLLQQFNFFVTVSNVGPVAVSNVFLTDLLPSGLSESYWVGYGGIEQNYNPTNGIWSITNIPPGQAYILNLGVVGTNLGSFTNVAQLVGCTPPDTNAANNSAAAVVNIIQWQADLAVTKTVSPSVMNTNGQVQFTITVQNNGPDTATNVVVQDNLPTGLSLISSNVPAGTQFNPGSGAWNIPSLLNGDVAMLGLTVKGTNAGNFTNIAFVASSGSVDPNLFNNTNSAVAIFVASPAADLGVFLLPVTNTAPVGGSILFECIVTNYGPNAATNIAAQLTYPAGMTISGVFGPFGSASFNTNTGVLTVFGALFPPVYEQVNIQFTLTNAGTFTPTFRITSSSLPDPILANNSASATVTGLVSYALSGGIVTCSGGALTNSPVVLTGPNSTMLTTNTGTNGSFTFSALFPGTYTVMPTNSNYAYNPASMTVTISNRNVTLTNFTALPRFISGTVLQGGSNGTPVVGVTMLLSGALTLTNTTDTNGMYLFTNLNAGTYTVTPRTNGFLGMVFAPTNATVTLGSLTNCAGSANFITTNQLIVLRALEVIQVVQDWSNSVVLIANKATLVRAHLQLYGTNTAPVLVDGARLYAQNLAGGNANWAPDNGRITVMTNNCAAPFVRSNITMSLNFTVRNGFKTGQDIYRFTWPNGVVINTEPADAAGDVASNGQVQVAYNVAPQLGVRFIRVAMTNGFTTNIIRGVTNIVAITNLPTLAQIEEEKRRLISIYPITQVTNLTPGYYFWKAPPNPSWADELALLEGLSAARLTSSDTNGIATNRIWYGVAPQGVSLRGAGYVPGPVAEGCISATPQNYQRHLAAHEIGHALGRPHDIRAAFGQGACGAGNVTGHCGECAPDDTSDFPMVNVPGLGFMPTLGPLSDDNQIIYGYDAYQSIIISPYTYYDVMSYCVANTGGVGGFPAGSLGPWPWNSKFTYTQLYTTNQARFGAGIAPALHQGLPVPGAGQGRPTPKGSPSSQPYLLVRGSIDDDSGLVSFAPCYPVASALPATPGPYTLVELDTNAVPLYALAFTPDVPESEFDDISDMNTFDLTVPIIEGAAALEIYSNNVPVGELVAESYPPTVQVLNPSAGQQFGNTDILASWIGSDPEGAPLYYLVQFSPDGGNSWDTLAIDLAQTNLDIPPDSLAATTNGLIRVIASDGFNTYTASPTGPFTIAPHVPDISILQPGSGALFYGDQTIVFEADAYDLEDGPLDGTNVLWNSSLDGPLGSGATLPLETVTLSEGVHWVTATAIASSGLTNVASVQIVVLRLPPPQLSIQLLNQQQVQLAWPMSYTNYLLESAASLYPSNWNTVTNVPAVSNLLQSVNLNLSSTNQFFRLRIP